MENMKSPYAKSESVSAGWRANRVERPEATTGNPLVRKIASFVTLTDSDRAALAAIGANARSVAADTRLLSRNDGRAQACLLSKGFACRSTTEADGSRQITDILVPGDISFRGLAALPSTVKTLCASEVVDIPHDALQDLIQARPAIGQAIYRSLLLEEAVLRAWLCNVGRRPAQARVAHLFCELVQRLLAVGAVHEEGIRLPLTAHDIGDALGLSCVHVNRVLQVMRQRDLIAFDGDAFAMLDLPGLRALAGFDGDYLSASRFQAGRADQYFSLMQGARPH